MNRVKTYFMTILLPLSIGSIVGLFISPYIDYETLKQPLLSPPSILFPIVWTILYILLGVSYGILKTKQLVNTKVKRIYRYQLFLNFMWSIFFFALKWRGFSFFWILVLVYWIWIMIREFYHQNKAAGLIQIPYFLWVIFATYLNLAIYLLNR